MKLIPLGVSCSILDNSSKAISIFAEDHMSEDGMHATFSSRRRNYMLSTHRKDGLIEWMKEMLNHSFVLDARETYADTFGYFEEIVEEHRSMKQRSRIKQYVPTVGTFFTHLPLKDAFLLYDQKYLVSKRHFVSPTFNEVRHILNLAQVMAIGENLQLITFDGDQTLYSDGGNFEENDELALGLVKLVGHFVKVAVVTAAGYGLDGSKYERRLQGLLTRFIKQKLTKEQIECFYVMGGECNYLMQCTVVEELNESTGEIERKAKLIPVPDELWQSPELNGPKPSYWPKEQIKELLDLAQEEVIAAIAELHLRAKTIRKERCVGIFPGGEEMCAVVPQGHGSRKLKREALDEVVLRVMDKIRRHQPPVTLPYCVFNGGRDAWLDIGNKSVGVAALQAFFKFPNENCLHVGDQFLETGNDIAVRESCPCIWIINPRETGKVLHNVLKYRNIPEDFGTDYVPDNATTEKKAPALNVYTGEVVHK